MFHEVKKKLGFGCMRLPMDGREVDYVALNKMVDAFLDGGFNYFDTAHGYVNTLSEIAVRECLVKRHPRDSFVLTNKLTAPYFAKQEEIRPFFEKQLAACGVEYFDFYLMHAQSKDVYRHFKKTNAYETAYKFKQEGKIKHFGISFHDTAEVLEEILTDHPEIEVVQLQLNYLDWLDPAIQSKACYDVCRKFDKPVIVMEPVKGGNLANLPDAAKPYIEALHGGSAASYAVRFAAGHEGVFMVLSGMSTLEQMRDNISYMQDFRPLDAREMQAVESVVAVFRGMRQIACTACRYCIDGCPKQISIPDLFACMNAKTIHKDWNADFYYNDVYIKNGGRASDCIACGKCEASCPQHLPIRDLLKDVAREFDKGAR